MFPPVEPFELRGNDPTGFGHYGAKRGLRKHRGLDIKTKPGQLIVSPISGKFKRVGRVYVSTSKFKLLEIENGRYRVRLLYAAPYLEFKPGDPISACSIIGVAQDIAGYHGNGMINHIHMEVYKHGLLTDPEPLLIPYEAI